MKIRQAKQRVSPSSPRPNPFAGGDDIYITKSKIAVTKTINRKTKRGFTKVTQTKYYVQNAENLRKLKTAKGETVRVGRTGTNYKKV